MAGDQAAFEKLVGRYKQHIVNIAYGIVGNTHDAEEIAQDAFLKAYLSLNKLADEKAFYRWLVKITTNLSINKKNSNARKSAHPIEELLLANPQQAPEAMLEQKELQRQILNALEQLPNEQRTVIVLRELQGFAYSEIADILDIPLGTVKSRINTARMHLRESLSKERL
jgi:RNA polymerase sigma-70 factor (ECF subfamily)